MSGPKKRAIRPNLGSSLRPRSKTPRKHALVTGVTREVYQQILQYCLNNKISVSQFLAELVLEDATKPKSDRKEKVVIKAEFELTPEQQEKLELLAKLHKKGTISELIHELLMPNLDLERLHGSLETTTLRYYLSKEEHEIVTKHIASKGISARKYAAMLALKAISQERKKLK